MTRVKGRQQQQQSHAGAPFFPFMTVSVLTLTAPGTDGAVPCLGSVCVEDLSHPSLWVCLCPLSSSLSFRGSFYFVLIPSAVLCRWIGRRIVLHLG